MAHMRGFGLIEMLVTLLIAGILATIAIPSFSRLLDKTRLKSATDDYMAALYGTRSYAVRNNTDATLCPSQDGHSCSSNSSDLSVGWLITANNELIRYWPAPGVTATAHYIASGVHFGPDGLPKSDSGSFQNGHVVFSVGTQAGCVVLAQTGRVHYESCDQCGCGSSS